VTEPVSTLAPLAIIVAVSRNGVIGRAGELPWHLPEDLKHFKRVTTGHAIIMGRKTHESIGRPLPKRRNIVVTRSGASFEGCETADSLETAIELARTSDACPVVIGGASLYEEALPLATELHLTIVDREVEGDTFFQAEFPGFEEAESRPGETEGVLFKRLRRAQ
jgi:dihydrofolate reductase